MLWSANAWALATISLNNYDSGNPIFYYQVGTLVPASGTFVELITPGGAVTLAGDSSSLIPMVEDGFFFGGIGIVPNLPDNAATQFTLRVWRVSTTFESSWERTSISWTQTTGSWNPDAVPPAPPTAPVMQVPHGLVFPLIPEPSTIALCLIGGAAMLLFRGRTLWLKTMVTQRRKL